MDDKITLSDAMELEGMGNADADGMSAEALYELGFRTGRRERNGWLWQ